MAFFKFRKAGEDTAAAAPAESVEVMRRRARHRLIGAAVLVLIGVVGFPLLFDTQPRPVQVDIPIDIPDRAKAKPLASAPAQTTTCLRRPRPRLRSLSRPPGTASNSRACRIWPGHGTRSPSQACPSPQGSAGRRPGCQGRNRAGQTCTGAQAGGVCARCSQS
jgi:hypothetical protein